jgi:hypothetical protein
MPRSLLVDDPCASAVEEAVENFPKSPAVDEKGPPERGC